MKLIQNQWNAFVLQVKSNQKNLEYECRLIPHRKIPLCEYDAWRNIWRWRRENRKVQVFERKDCDTPEADTWSNYVSYVIVVTRKTWVMNTQKKCSELRTEQAYYVSNKCFTAQEYEHIIRSHWGIENQLHCVRDVSMQEDKSRIRRKPEKFFFLRTRALNIMRGYWVTNIAKTMDESHLSLEYLLKSYWWLF